MTTAPIRTQTEAVLDYLREVGPLTQHEASARLGVARLGARVWDLKQRGHAIHTELVEAPSRYGGPARVARYSLQEESA